MTDTVERLRRYAKNQGGWHMIDETCEEAADEIERLREALKPFAKLADALVDQGADIVIGLFDADFIRARDVLRGDAK